MKKHQDLYMGRDRIPCSDQTEDEIGAYYRAAKVGDLMVIRHTQGGFCDYELLRIARFNQNRSRVYGPNHPAYYTKHGRNCFHPHGQSTLRRPTLAILDYCDTYEMVAHRGSNSVATEDARALLLI